jgi:hypothetical protein
MRVHRLIDDALAAGNTFVDGGAHVGYNTMYGSRKVGPAGWIIAIEPRQIDAGHRADDLPRWLIAQGFEPRIAWHATTERLRPDDIDRIAKRLLARKGSVELAT